MWSGRCMKGYVECIPDLEIMEIAAIREAKYKKKVEQYYDKGFSPWLSKSKTLSAAGTKQVEWRTRASWALTGKDLIG
ncbi:hypothetical protein Tco_1100742 [Tanacetum coccineum]